jgi:hypothetical protein
VCSPRLAVTVERADIADNRDPQRIERLPDPALRHRLTQSRSTTARSSSSTGSHTERGEEPASAENDRSEREKTTVCGEARAKSCQIVPTTHALNDRQFSRFVHIRPIRATWLT